MCSLESWPHFNSPFCSFWGTLEHFLLHWTVKTRCTDSYGFMSESFQQTTKHKAFSWCEVSLLWICQAHSVSFQWLSTHTLLCYQFLHSVETELWRWTRGECFLKQKKEPTGRMITFFFTHLLQLVGPPPSGQCVEACTLLVHVWVWPTLPDNCPQILIYRSLLIK